jgi:hypothetical protein
MRRPARMPFLCAHFPQRERLTPAVYTQGIKRVIVTPAVYPRRPAREKGADPHGCLRRPAREKCADPHGKRGLLRSTLIFLKLTGPFYPAPFTCGHRQHTTILPPEPHVSIRKAIEGFTHYFSLTVCLFPSFPSTTQQACADPHGSTYSK